MIDLRICCVSQHVTSKPACMRQTAQIKTRQEAQEICPSKCERQLINVRADILVGCQSLLRSASSAKPLKLLAVVAL